MVQLVISIDDKAGWRQSLAGKNRHGWGAAGFHILLRQVHSSDSILDAWASNVKGAYSSVMSMRMQGPDSVMSPWLYIPRFA